VKLRNGYVTKM